MENITHPNLVKALVKPGWQIVGELLPVQAELLHMAVGVSGESGELLDAIKKNCLYQKELDRENVVEELGDLEFYMEGLRQIIGITREECLQHNIAKLSKRYEKLSYSNQAAIDRKDKSDSNS